MKHIFYATKRKAILFLLLLSVSHCLIGQSSYSTVASEYGLKAPDVAAFEAVNFFPLDEYTGRANVSIPIYEIDIDGIVVPISLSYNTGGIRVDDLASRVGLGWALNAGGMITKNIKGKDDFVYSQVLVTENELWINELGYLMPSSFLYNNFPIFPGVTDGEPDLYNVSVPGMQTKFVHDATGNPFELNNQGNIIETVIGTLPQSVASNYLYPGWKDGLGQQLTFGTGVDSYDVHKIKIVSNKGFEYQFNDWEHTYNNSQKTSFYHSSYPISKVKSNRTKEEINFQYERVDLYRYDFFNTSINGTDIKENKASLWLKKIIKIEFDEGEVLFHYDMDREDLAGDTALTQIEIINKNGDLIKRVHFKYSYFLTNGCSEANCKRLRLDEVYFSNNIKEYLPGYKLDYNTTKLPKRHAPQTDFSGYYNGIPASATPDIEYPTQYFYIDSNKSLLPFTINGDTNYYTVQGTYNLNASINYAKAASLEQMTYPTGGRITLDYELNSFLAFNTEIQGGGLRIKRNTQFNKNGVVERDINYGYNTASNITSGSILTIPRFSDVAFNYSSTSGSLSHNNLNVSNVGQNVTFKTQNRNVNRLYFTKGSLVGYSKVTLEEIGNGKIIKEFTNPISNPDLLPSISTNENPNGGNSYDNYKFDWLQFKIDYNFFPSFKYDNEILRGNLTKEQVFDNTGQILKKTENNFNHETFESIPIGEAFNHPAWEPYDGPCCRAIAGSNLFKERNKLTQSTVTDYLENGERVSSNNYEYHALYDFIKEESIESATGESRKKQWVYPIDAEVSSLPFIDVLIDRNRISTPIKTLSLKNNQVLNEELIHFNNFENGFIEPSSVDVRKANYAFQAEVVFNKYDPDNANLIEFTAIDNTTTALIWGYNKKKVVAKVVGSNYNEVLNTGIDLNIINAPQSEAELLTELNKIRVAFESNKDVEVVTSLYKPLVGVTKTIDEKDYSTSYTYDTFNRLNFIKDEEDNVVKEYQYNYTNWQNTPEVLSAYLTYEAISEGNGGQYSVKANVQNGSGNYSYTWVHGFTTEAESSNNELIISNAELTPQIASITNNSPFGLYEYNSIIDSQAIIKAYEEAGWNFNICSEGSVFSQAFVGVICIIRDISTGQEVKRISLLPRYFQASAPSSPQILISQSTYSPYIIIDVSMSFYCGGSGNYMYQWNGGTETSNSYFQIVYNCGQGNINVTGRVRDVVTGQLFYASGTILASNIDCSEADQNCFIAGTSIQMADGSEKSIEKIKQGDTILTYNIEKKKVERGEVKTISSPLHSNFIEITFNNKTINTNTWDHPYYVKDKGWSSYNPELTDKNYGLKVGSLMEGDVCLVYNAKTKTIKESKIISLKTIKEKLQTYNLTEVSKNNNFFANGILVHNKFNK